MVAGERAEFVLHPDLPSLGAQHDFVEAAAFAKIAVAAEPAVLALIEYARAEATGILQANADILDELVNALVGLGTLDGGEVDEIISAGVARRLSTGNTNGVLSGAMS